MPVSRLQPAQTASRADQLLYITALGSDKAQDLIDQIAARYEGGGGGMARQMQMGPGMMNGPPGGMGGPPSAPISSAESLLPS